MTCPYTIANHVVMCRLGFLFVVIGLVTPTSMWAEVLRIVVDKREDVLEGRVFGGGGVYEKIVGRVFFVFDPANPHDDVYYYYLLSELYTVDGLNDEDGDRVET